MSGATSEYARFLGELKALISRAKVSAARAVNCELVALYWDIGAAIQQKQAAHGWGDSVVETLARDLKAAFPDNTGFSKVNLWRMRQLHASYTSKEFLSHLVREMQSAGQHRRGVAAKLEAESLSRAVREMVVAVPWGHHVNSLAALDDPAQRLYYLRATARFGWTRAVLLNQIKAQAYERSLADDKSHNFPAALPEHLAEQAEEALKSRYNLEFLGIGQVVKERELEDRLIDRLRDFILELGYGFCFVGRQYRLSLANKDYFIDCSDLRIIPMRWCLPRELRGRHAGGGVGIGIVRPSSGVRRGVE